MIMANLFETVTGLQTSLLDSTQLEDLCVQQRTLTMNQIAEWLRSNAKIFELEWDTVVSRELKHLADDLDHIAELKDYIRKEPNNA